MNESIHLRLGSIIKRVRLLMLLGERHSVSEYVRQCVERCVTEDLNKHTNALLYMRPGQVVYSVSEKNGERTYTALTRTLGGERCWVLAFLPNVPKAMGGENGILCDITVEPGKQGCDARNVVVTGDAIYGPTTSQGRTIPPVSQIGPVTDGETHL